MAIKNKQELVKQIEAYGLKHKLAELARREEAKRPFRHLPKQFSKLIQFGLEGKAKEAYAIHYPIMTSIDMIFEEGNPAGIKALLESLGICSDRVRLPLLSASPDLKNRIDVFLKKNASLAQ